MVLFFAARLGENHCGDGNMAPTEVPTMQRNNKLLYMILESLKDDDNASTNNGSISLSFEGHSKAEIHYHVLLLHDVGYVQMAEGSENPSRLTWAGYNFLVGPVQQPPRPSVKRHL